MTWWNYLLLVNVYLLLFYSFYSLLLRRETFFQLNRIYLVAAALLSFFIPLIQSTWVKNLFITQKVQQTIYSNPAIQLHFRPIPHNTITVGQLLMVVYISVILFLTGRLIWQLFSLKKIINQPDTVAPYSFFKKVKLGNQKENLEIISAHEQAHASQWHSADVLMIEAVMIINWFNPVVYFYRFAIKHIHEFIADRQALKSGTDKTDYAMLLLSQTFNAPAHQMVNPFFNHSLLKQRIMMLQKSKSHRIALVKYCLSAPLFVLMLILSSATVYNSKPIQFIGKKTDLILQSPTSNLSGNIKIENKKQEQIPTVKNIEREAVKEEVIKGGSVILTDTIPAKKGPVYTTVEKIPQFPGGMDAFYKFLAANVRYPAEAREKKIQGRVIVSFIVEEDGSISNSKIARGIGGGADEETLRVISLSPNWEPGTQNGKPVRVAYSVPVSFTLSGEENPVDNKRAINLERRLKGLQTINEMGVVIDKVDSTNNMIYAHINQQPLYIIDGKQTNYTSYTSLGGITPNDIESITVLKNKDAIATYGPKAANGVIIIVTKKNNLKVK